jgi:transposase InsO family protein
LKIKDYQYFEEAEANIGEFIEEVYNKKRLHSSLVHDQATSWAMDRCS